MRGWRVGYTQRARDDLEYLDEDDWYRAARLIADFEERGLSLRAWSPAGGGRAFLSDGRVLVVMALLRDERVSLVYHVGIDE